MWGKTVRLYYLLDTRANTNVWNGVHDVYIVRRIVVRRQTAIVYDAITGILSTHTCTCVTVHNKTE